MLENFTIARIAGIPIRANLLLGYLLALWAIAGAANGYAGLTIVLIVLSTALLLLHELGHAFVARRFGLQVVDIVLWPLGGMARISDMPENPRVEGWIAAAGPLVNLGLAALAAPLLLVLGGGEPRFNIDLPGLSVPVSDDVAGIVTLFVLINLAYGLFNLVPAFPMDGGRLFRAFLARGGRSWLAATERAASVSSVLAWTLIITSILAGACFLPLVGLFVLWAGLRERWVVRLRHQAEAFGGAQGRFAGWEALLRRTQGGDTPFADETIDPRPAEDAASGFGPEAGGGGGFSDEDIERLESFRGRLQKPNREAEA